MAAGPGHVALGAWSGGRYLHYGEPLDEERLVALLTPDDAIGTLITADAYGAGEADAVVGRALAAGGRDRAFLIGAIGHDFYEGEREGPKGFPRFTDPRLRGPEAYGDYIRMATERSLERLGTDRFDLLLLHNPDRTGYTSETVWAGMAAVRDAGLADRLGVAPGPANGFTLDVIDCFERFGELLSHAMVILGPMEPWPGELVLDAAAHHGIDVITRVVDYGGLLWDDVRPGHELAPRDHRGFRPPGWIEAGVDRIDAMRPVAERHGLTLLQLACAWNLARPAVTTCVPTLIQEPGGRPIEDKRAELARTPARPPLAPEEVAALRAVGDNTGTMALKGASPGYEGAEMADRWGLDEDLAALAGRWGIEPARDLVKTD